MTWAISDRVSPRANHEAGFGEDGGVALLDLVEQAEGLEVAGAGRMVG